MATVTTADCVTPTWPALLSSYWWCNKRGRKYHKDSIYCNHHIYHYRLCAIKASKHSFKGNISINGKCSARRMVVHWSQDLRIYRWICVAWAGIAREGIGVWVPLLPVCKGVWMAEYNKCCKVLSGVDGLIMYVNASLFTFPYREVVSSILGILWENTRECSMFFRY